MGISESIHDVFKTQGQPTVTYVERQEGKFEQRLIEALESKGLLCLVTGPSKTGKTTLYTKVARDMQVEPLRVRCNDQLDAVDLWRQALEEVNFEQISEIAVAKERKRSAGAKLGGKIGWVWLANLSGEASVDISSSASEAETRKKILAAPSPKHLVPILSRLPYLLVIEDFHYLRSEVKKTVFQQWKVFVDNEISVIVVGTTHHAADLAYANTDLIGRYTQIDLTNWDTSDLEKIPSRGFDQLKITVPSTSVKTIAAESVGLPIITQSVCLEMALNKMRDGGNVPKPLNELKFSTRDVFRALHRVAVNKYGGYEPSYDRLTRGPRKKARKYNTYELILLAFNLDPLKFSLTREEIPERLQSLPIEKQQIPPAGSITSTLNALGKFQQRLAVQLLEWSANDQRLYILEPTFLFYIRWRQIREMKLTVSEQIYKVLKDLGIEIHPGAD